MAVATDVPKKATGAKKAAKPLPDFKIGQTLIRKTDASVIVGKNRKGNWIVEEEDNWGSTEYASYTTAQLAKEYNILELG